MIAASVSPDQHCPSELRGSGVGARNGPIARSIGAWWHLGVITDEDHREIPNERDVVRDRLLQELRRLLSIWRATRRLHFSDPSTIVPRLLRGSGDGHAIPAASRSSTQDHHDAPSLHVIPLIIPLKGCDLRKGPNHAASTVGIELQQLNGSAHALRRSLGRLSAPSPRRLGAAAEHGVRERRTVRRRRRRTMWTART